MSHSVGVEFTTFMLLPPKRRRTSTPQNSTINEITKFYESNVTLKSVIIMRPYWVFQFGRSCTENEDF
jgi:hypothetical protein